MEIKVKKLKESAQLPTFATKGSAGADVRACLDMPFILCSGTTIIVPTGISIELPEGYECQVRPRSGLAAKYGVTVLNSPGTIDSDYRGEIKVILTNFGSDSVMISDGERIAQLVIAKCEQPSFVEVSEIDETERGECGFGGTGTK